MNMKEEIERVQVNFEEAKEKLKPNIADLKDQVVSNMNAMKEQVVSNVELAKEEVQNVLSDFQNELNGSFILLIGILGLYLNAKLIYKVLTERKRDWLILNLAIANMCLILTVFPFSGYASFAHKWIWGDSTCQYYGFMGLFFGYVMMTTVPMIAIDEYLAYDWPPYIVKRDKITKLMILYTWLNTLLWSLTPLFGWSSISYEAIKTSCTVIYKQNDGYESYIFFTFIFCYVLPIAALYFCKTQYGSNIVELSATTKSAMTLSTRTFLLLSAFLLCWTPYALVYIWPIVTKAQPESLLFIALGPLFAKLSVVLSPLVLLRVEDEHVKVQ